MDILKKLHDDTILLVDSIVFKLDYIGVQETLKYMDITGVDDYILRDKSTWKYYNNLLGIKHAYNNEVIVESNDTDESFLLTKENLLEHPLTRYELYNHNKTYTDLINKYPLDVTYINGVVYNIQCDMDTLITNDDGVILMYNKDLVEDNEYDLIQEVQEYIQGYLSRWYNHQYVLTDNLYLSSLLGVLYPKLVLKIMNIRLRNIHTYQVHSIYVDLFFQNHHYLHKHIHVLNRESKMWLYRNLRYLNNHIGKDYTLQRIIDNVYTTNNVGVGEIKRVAIQDELDELPINFKTKLPSLITEGFQYTARNESFLLLNKVIDSPSNILMREMNGESQHYLPMLEDELSRKQTLNIDRTKMLLVDRSHNVELSNIQKINLAVEFWFYTALNGTYINTKIYRDITTGATYKLSTKQGMLLFIKILSDWLDGTGMVHKFTHREVPIKTDKHALSYNLWLTDSMDKYIDIVLTRYPDYDIIRTDVSIMEHIHKILKYSGDMTVYVSNIDSEYHKALAKDINLRVFKKGQIKICDTPTHIDELLLNSGVHYYKEDRYDHIGNLYKLLSTFTGLSEYELKSIDTSREHFRNILKKVVSYTVQVLDNEHSNNIVHQKVPFNSINRIDIPQAVSIKEGYIDCLHDISDMNAMWDVIYKPIEVDITFNDVRFFNVEIDRPSMYKDELDCNIVGNGVILDKLDNYMSCKHFIGDIEVTDDYVSDATVESPYASIEYVKLDKPDIGVSISCNNNIVNNGVVMVKVRNDMTCEYLIGDLDVNIISGYNVTVENTQATIINSVLDTPKITVGICNNNMVNNGVIFIRPDSKMTGLHLIDNIHVYTMSGYNVTVENTYTSIINIKSDSPVLTVSNDGYNNVNNGVILLNIKTPMTCKHLIGDLDVNIIGGYNVTVENTQATIINIKSDSPVLTVLNNDHNSVNNSVILDKLDNYMSCEHLIGGLEVDLMTGYNVTVKKHSGKICEITDSDINVGTNNDNVISNGVTIIKK